MPDAAFGGEGGQAFGDNGAAFQVAENNPKPATGRTWDANSVAISKENMAQGTHNSADHVKALGKLLRALDSGLTPLGRDGFR